MTTDESKQAQRFKMPGLSRLSTLFAGNRRTPVTSPASSSPQSISPVHCRLQQTSSPIPIRYSSPRPRYSPSPVDRSGASSLATQSAFGGQSLASSALTSSGVGSPESLLGHPGSGRDDSRILYPAFLPGTIRGSSFRDIDLALVVLENVVITEIAQRILHFAEYYNVLTTARDRPVRILQEPRPVLTIPTLTPQQREQVVQITLEVWSNEGGLRDEGGERDDSWLLLTLGDQNAVWDNTLMDGKSEAPTTVHRFDWRRGNDQVECVKNGSMLTLWARVKDGSPSTDIEYVKWSISLCPF